MVGLWTETFCRIICDTADFKLQYMVISVLHNMKKIESSHIRIKTQGFIIHLLFDKCVFICVTKDCEKTEIDLEHCAQQFLLLLRKTYISETTPSSNINKAPDAQTWIMMLLRGYNDQYANQVIIQIENELKDVVTVFNFAIESLIAKSGKINTLAKRIDNLYTMGTFKSLGSEVAQNVKSPIWKAILWISSIYWICSLCYILIIYGKT
ncbi:hypothetical protein HN011_006120 [Eciton burchellii]|nr:hypothetical protein HN011_006120 [Eciton burchellii]